MKKILILVLLFVVVASFNLYAEEVSIDKVNSFLERYKNQNLTFIDVWLGSGITRVQDKTNIVYTAFVSSNVGKYYSNALSYNKINFVFVKQIAETWFDYSKDYDVNTLLSVNIYGFLTKIKFNNYASLMWVFYIDKIEIKDWGDKVITTLE